LVQLQAEGAPEDFIQTARGQIDRELDRAHLRAYMERARDTDFSRQRFEVPFPVLYLRMLRFPGADSEDGDEIMRQLVPQAESDSLEKWGNRLHVEEGGRELGGRVVAFVERVMASDSREAAASP
jgi:hypothetical protein